MSVIPTNKKIVIIEDDPAICSMYEFKFKNEGYDVRIAHNGQEGLEVIKTHKPELILLDLRMPVMSGDTMLEKLQKTKQGSNIKVMILTNISKDEAPSSLRFLHVDRYIVKAHHTPTQVVDMVKEILG